MEPVVAVEPAASRLVPRWPHSARPHGVDLSATGILTILLGMTALAYLLIWALPQGLNATGVAGRLAVIHGLELALWLSIVGLLGWWRAAGLAAGSASPWGIVPVTAFCLAILLGARLTDALPYGAGYLFFVISDCLGAIREEVAFRGFLLHGLTRRLGGTSAALVGSMLFAVYHVPRYLREQIPLTEMAALLLVAFGVGVFLCRVRAETGSIWIPAAIHTFWNVLVGVGIWVFPDGDPAFGFRALQAAPFAVGIVMALLLLMPQRGAAATKPLQQTV
ncbi:MAG: lysostaphin resistance A-like protein [Actinomycetota bacterium]